MGGHSSLSVSLLAGYGSQSEAIVVYDWESYLGSLLWVTIYFLCATVASRLVSVYLFFVKVSLRLKMWNYMHAVSWLIYDREFEDSERDNGTTL